IIALLVALLLPALSAARASAIRLQCGTQLASIGQVLNAFAADNNALPMRVPAGNVTYDTLYPHVVTPNADSSLLERQLLQYGSDRNVYYCPANFGERTPEEWWPLDKDASTNFYKVSMTYQFSFWVAETRWLIEKPNLQ